MISKFNQIDRYTDNHRNKEGSNRHRNFGLGDEVESGEGWDADKANDEGEIIINFKILKNTRKQGGDDSKDAYKL